MSELSEFEEMYLKRIFEAHFNQPDEIVKTSQLAELMSVSAASTTEMIQRLSNRDYLTYIPYKGCRLTSLGFKHASSLKRREELLRILLSDVIRYEGDVDSAACKLEHNIDNDLEASIDRMLGYPERNKEGSLIPLVDRNLMVSGRNNLLPISALPENTDKNLILDRANHPNTFLFMEIVKIICNLFTENKYFCHDPQAQDVLA